jgi:hypothetical protein
VFFAVCLLLLFEGEDIPRKRATQKAFVTTPLLLLPYSAFVVFAGAQMQRGGEQQRRTQK